MGADMKPICVQCGCDLEQRELDFKCVNHDGCGETELGWFIGSGGYSPFRVDDHIQRDDDAALFADDDEATVAALRLLQSDDKEVWDKVPYTRAELAAAICNSVNDIVYCHRKYGSEPKPLGDVCPDCGSHVIASSHRPDPCYHCNTCSWYGLTPERSE
tara:strand:+ start:526 stop:1002 length:477 start_codon:yes stop_codon:yes gene_type:complete